MVQNHFRCKIGVQMRRTRDFHFSDNDMKLAFLSSPFGLFKSNNNNNKRNKKWKHNLSSIKVGDSIHFKQQSR